MTITQSYPHIAFEGPIGVGKTTIATLFSRMRDSKLVLEKFSENEFLADYYEEPKRWAFAMQLWFFAARLSELPEFSRPRSKVIVSDYTFAKDAIFARVLLCGRELKLYEHLAESLQVTVPSPKLIVYLDANDDQILQRIQHRNRPYERNIDADLICRLRRSYEIYLSNIPAMRILRIDTSQFKIGSTPDLTELSRMVDTILEA